MAPGNNRLRSAKIVVSYLTVAIVPVIYDELTRLRVKLRFFLKKSQKNCNGCFLNMTTEIVGDCRISLNQ
jgi:hypothetical protein